jgi:protein ImuB
MRERYACLDAKQFPLQALLRLRPELEDKPVAVLDGEPPLEAVCACSRTAQSLGVCLGMTRLEVEMFPTVRILRRSRAEEETARAAMLECAGSFSPRVEDQSDDLNFTCVIDISGTDTLFGSAEALGERLRKKTQALRLYGSIAISSNFHAARCLARAGWSDKPVLIVAKGGESAALAHRDICYVGYLAARRAGRAGRERVDCPFGAGRENDAAVGAGSCTAFIPAH